MKVTEIQNLNDIICLRQDVLHPHGDVSKVSYAKDLDPGTRHYGYYENGVLLATGTLIPENEDEALSETEYRIRGMAVAPEVQGQGLGQEILACMFEYLKTKPKAQKIWCNARVQAFTLYTRFGFVIFEPEFDIPGSGPHKRLRLNLSPTVK